jgi:clan AA aspartic protease
MGKTIVQIKVANQADEILAQQGVITPDQVRSIETDALVDTGATFLCLRKSLIEKLQLTPVVQKSVKTSNGPTTRTIYSAVTIYFRDRFAVIFVSELPDDCPNLLGQIPLHAMDWVVDTKTEKLIGNPEHGGEWMLEEYQEM